MGQLLERAIRRKKLSIAEYAATLNISRRTLYNWLNQQVLDEATMARLAKTLRYDSLNCPVATIVNDYSNKCSLIIKNTSWKDRYVNLIESYSKLTTPSHKDTSLSQINR